MTKAFKTNNFDLLRIFAATQVLVNHSLHHLFIKVPNWFLPFQYLYGVPIFFTISGYLISASYERSGNLKNYFQNRLLRIYPGLWGCILLTIIVTGLFGISYLNKYALSWILSQMFGLIYTPQFLSKFGFGSYNGSLWTIPVELQFYIVLPLIYWLIVKWKSNNYIVFVLFFISVAIAIIIKLFSPDMGTVHESGFQKLIRYSFLPHFYLFLAGVTMQRVNLYRSMWIQGKGIYWLVIYIPIAFISIKIPAMSIFATLVLSVCVISLAYSNTSLSNKILKGNDISYGVYIYHGLLINILVENKLFYSQSYLIFILISAYILGYCSWVYIEKPFLRRKKQTINDQFLNTIAV